MPNHTTLDGLAEPGTATLEQCESGYVGYTEGYNAGWEHAVGKFEVVILLLAASFIVTTVTQILRNHGIDRAIPLGRFGTVSMLNILDGAADAVQWTLTAYLAVTVFIQPLIATGM